ncbi:MAG: DUF177 domain-containing protein [Meiothermus sp.]|nr:DUF177 domain-containing protein [Meiothermus sp.]
MRPNEIPSINFAHILREGGTTQALGEIVGQIELEHERIPLDGAAKWKASATRVDGEQGLEFWLSGEIAGTALLECARCLDPTPTPVRANFQYMLRYQNGLHGLEVVEEGDEEIFLFGNPSLDLTPFLSEAFALELPYTVLCREDCQGLCEHCGANLNRTPDCCEARKQPKEGKMAAALQKLNLEGLD